MCQKLKKVENHWHRQNQNQSNFSKKVFTVFEDAKREESSLLLLLLLLLLMLLMLLLRTHYVFERGRECVSVLWCVCVYVCVGEKGGGGLKPKYLAGFISKKNVFANFLL